MMYVCLYRINDVCGSISFFYQYIFLKYVGGINELVYFSVSLFR